MGQRASNKYGSFDNDIQHQLGPTVDDQACFIKVALGRSEIFYHKQDIQTGGNQKCCNLLKLIVKNSEFKSNSRTILKKWIFSSTFPAPK